jgi:hypothetical protein
MTGKDVPAAAAAAAKMIWTDSGPGPAAERNYDEQIRRIPAHLKMMVCRCVPIAEN